MSEKNVFDTAFDAMLVEALKQSEAKSDLPQTMNVEFSARHNSAMKKIFDGERKKMRRHGAMRIAGRIAACVAVFAVVSGTAVMSVSALRVRFLNFVFNTYQTNTEITASENAQNGKYDTDEVTVEYIPSGFVLQRQQITDTTIFLVFGNETDRVKITVSQSEGLASVDTEGSQCEEVEADGRRGLYVENERGNTLIMHDNEIAYMLQGTISRDELIKIAQGLKKKNV